MKLILFLNLLVLLSCGKNLGTNEGTEFRVFDINSSNITFANINDLILRDKCLNCHDWASSEAEFDKRIIPGDPENSPMYQQIASGAMPLGGPELTNSEKDLIYQFILNKVSVVEEVPPAPAPAPTPIDEPNGPSIEVMALVEQVKTEILIPNCQLCHGWVSEDEAIFSRIVPGKPEQSRLYLLVENGSMPPFGALPEAEVELIKEMIIALGE